MLKRDLLVPAAAAAAGLLAVYLRIAESPYLTSKGYAVAAPFAMLLAARALLEPWPQSVRMPALRIAKGAAAALFCAAALYSSYKVLHGGEVGPRAHTDELRAIADDLRDEPTLFLGFDDFSLWELHGVPVALPQDGFHLPVPDRIFERRPEKQWAYGDPFDFDSVRWQDLRTRCATRSPRARGHRARRPARPASPRCRRRRRSSSGSAGAPPGRG